ncbi:hypothetical protein Drorol1_Dr00003719 [Drosera rotundifolia]
MGCFLACFGVTNDRSPRHPRRRRLNDVSPRTIRNQGDQCKFVGKQLSPALKQDDLEKLKTLTEYSRVESREQRSSETRKKETFDSNITSYKHVSVDEVAVISPHCGEVAENLVVSDSVKATNSASVFKNGLVSSYRYQSYREDEDEDGEEELHRERTDLEVDQDESENDDDHDGSFDELDYDNYEDESRHGAVCPETQTMAEVSLQSLVDSEINELMSYVQTLDMKRSTMGCDHGARDRSRYVSSVLNPVENTAQWKSVQAKDTALLKPQKENKSSKEEPYSSVDPFPHKSGAKSDESKHDQEIAVDASLSTWLVSNEKTPKAKMITTGLEAIPSHGSNSLHSEENKLMPGFLTVEQIKKFSASSTPKRSPIRNLDDTPMTDSCLVSSFKGIPNTTSKYREDKRVNWHSTPFETRLDRALNKSTGQYYSTSSAWLRATDFVE